MPYVPDLGRLLTDSCRLEDGGTGYDVEPYDLGPVVLPTGRVVGCDPLLARAVPFVDAVTPGRYQLRAWVAILSKDDAESQRRIAALQLVVLDEPVADWTLVLCPGKDVASLSDDRPPPHALLPTADDAARQPRKNPQRHRSSAASVDAGQLRKTMPQCTHLPRRARRRPTRRHAAYTGPMH